MLTPDRLAETVPASVLPAGERSDLLAALTRRSPPAVRLRPGVADDVLPRPGRLVPWFARGRTFDPGARPGGWLPYGTGAYYIQDAASLLPLALATVRPGETVCDLCAAPGGKATGLAEMLGETGWLLANEPIRARVDVLTLNLARHGSTRHVVVSLDPDRLADRLPGSFDWVVVDAPCSGQSMLAEGKQSASAFLPATVAHAAARQTRILAAAARLVRPGGRLVYSTCTFAVAEDEEVVGSWLSDHSDWSVEPEPTLAAWESPLLAGSYRLWPHRDGGGGGFAVRLRREGDADDAGPLRRSTATMSRRRERTRSPRRGPAAPEVDLAAWGTWRGGPTTVRGPCLYGWPDDPPEGWTDLLVGGPEVAFQKGKTWFPAYALAMRRDETFRPHQSATLSDGDAAAYLAGAAVEPASGADVRGWAVATWGGRALGWVKSDGRQLKNHLPRSMVLHVDLAS